MLLIDIGARLMQTRNGMFNQINITPLTDIFLVLVVVMIIIAPENQRSVLKIDPPSAIAYPPAPPLDESKFVHLQINNEGKVSIEGRVLTNSNSATIETALRTIQKERGTKDLPVKITPSALTTQQSLVSAIDASCGAGVKTVSIDKAVDE